MQESFYNYILSYGKNIIQQCLKKRSCDNSNRVRTHNHLVRKQTLNYLGHNHVHVLRLLKCLKNFPFTESERKLDYL